MVKYVAPEFSNTDEGLQVISSNWVEEIKEAKVKTLMDGRGCWIDNCMIEHLWRSLKDECVYRRVFETGSEVREGKGNGWLTTNNAERPRSSMGIMTPDEVYASESKPMRMGA